MAINNSAFVWDILPNSSAPGDLAAVHQTSPSWILTFLRWKIRDTLRTNPTGGADWTTVDPKPLVVENDCIQVSVSDSKSVLTPSMTATLKITDVNYETELSPGDFVFVNILNWEKDATRVSQQARNLSSINGVKDGFKGFFKIQSVRKALMVEPSSGRKILTVKITGFAFTEFNNSIYFNPYLIGQSDQNFVLFTSQLNIDWASIQANKGLNQLQYLLKALIQCFIGTGFTDQGRKVANHTVFSANTHFYMPQGVGALLGLDSLESAKDAYNFLFGIQEYSSNSNQTPQQGMNPDGVPEDATKKDRFMFIPGSPVDGFTVAKPEYWNQSKAWSILNQFTNAPLNELYTCFRIAPNGSVMPTMVFRQIPFTTDNFKTDSSYKVTRFMNVPRWKIDPSLSFGFDLGKDETARFNFVQYYGRSVNGPSNVDIAMETAKQNYVYDLDDVKRNGLKSYIISTDFDRNPGTKLSFRSPGWAKILGDAVMGGHLRMSGTISFVGIPEPIAVGDNLEFDGIVYHIEQVMHSAFISENGKRSFRTSISVSNGMDITNGADGVVYAEMTNGGGQDSRVADYENSKILPGVSESQLTSTRPVNPDFGPEHHNSFPEPNTNTSIKKTKR